MCKIGILSKFLNRSVKWRSSFYSRWSWPQINQICTKIPNNYLNWIFWFQIDGKKYFKVTATLFSCNSKGEAYYCEVDCDRTFDKCLTDCTGSHDPTGCRSLCNRDHIICIDRCPCHDKCSWGCPCGFYQCDPLCWYYQDEEPSSQCADVCIMQAEDHIYACIGTKPEDVCYEEANKGPFFENLVLNVPKLCFIGRLISEIFQNFNF